MRLVTFSYQRTRTAWKPRVARTSYNAVPFYRSLGTSESVRTTRVLTRPGHCEVDAPLGVRIPYHRSSIACFKERRYARYVPGEWRGGVPEIMTTHYQPADQPLNHNSGQIEGDPTPATIRLLESNSDQAFADSEIRQELVSMVRVMSRLEELASRKLAELRGTEDAPETQAEDIESGPASQELTHPGEVRVGGHIVAFDPFEFEVTPDVESPFHQTWRPERASETEHAQTGDVSALQQDEELEDEHLSRWWIHFNGNVSLERLSRLRRIMSDSPFTFEARFDEITDGLIVMKLVTERRLPESHVDWIIRQVMDVVGLERDAAILSRG
jgi:hypothetical protein